MGAQSNIEWTDSTFNPWVGCTKVARAGGAPSACDFCYAEKWAKRSGQVEWGNHPRRRTTEVYWREPEDIANAVAFLASPESGWITAQVLTVDGGRMDYIGHT
jgi:NAD(P)-dependent dehydrogenase (short-subunit alcohol dehydrogenase family)